MSKRIAGAVAAAVAAVALAAGPTQEPKQEQPYVTSCPQGPMSEVCMDAAERHPLAAD